jgi:hypothetical protein
MPTSLDALRAEIADLQSRLAAELASTETALRFTLHRGRAVFDAETLAAHTAAREGIGQFLSHTRLLHLLTAPVIYSMILPFALLDLFVTVYQAICFPVYHIEKVRRADHILIDRQYLGYLNFMQKLNCVYCSYCNGLVSYVREIAGRTEAYWCPIKHSRRMADTHDHHAGFVDYGDAAAWQAHLAAQRAAERDKAPPKA